MQTRFLRLACGLAAALSGLVASTASAETCLQRFSCKLYGECRLPCLDDVLGTHPPAPDPGKADGQAVAPMPTDRRAATAATTHRPAKVARREAAHPPRLVVARDVGSVDSLAGKPVSFGPNGSPSQAMGRKLFAQLGIKIIETPLDVDNALDGVASGDVAAVLLVKPRDVARIKGSNDVHVLVVPDRAVARGG